MHVCEKPSYVKYQRHMWMYDYLYIGETFHVNEKLKKERPKMK